LPTIGMAYFDLGVGIKQLLGPPRLLHALQS
jgi:hypothetical protein